MNIEAFIKVISTSTQHQHLYHFTDESNFPSIDKKGLVSKERMQNEGWWPMTTGGNELSQSLDKLRGIDPYVSLCFTQNHRMRYLAHRDGRLPTPRYLQIAPEVLRIDGTKVAFGIANANETKILPIEEALDELDIEVIYQRTNWSDPQIQARLQAAEKFEILIPNAVPREMIVGAI